jgi:hypothetical protein
MGAAAAVALLAIGLAGKFAGHRHEPYAADLYQECKLGDVGCYDYLRGVWDGMQLDCGPHTPAEMRTAFLAYAAAHREEMVKSSSHVAVEALLDGFGCGHRG